MTDNTRQQNVNDVIVLMRFNNQPHWRIMQIDGNRMISSSPPHENYDLDQGETDFRQVCRSLASGRYRAILADSIQGRNQRGDMTHHVFAVGSENAIPAIAGPYDNFQAREEALRREFELRMKIYSLEQELIRAREEEAPNNNAAIAGLLESEAGQQIIGAVAAIAGQWLQKMMGNNNNQPAAQPTNAEDYKPL